MKLLHRDGSPVPDGAMVRLRDLHCRSLWFLARHRRDALRRYLGTRWRQWTALPGDRFYDVARMLDAEVIRYTPRVGGVLLVTSRESRMLDQPGHRQVVRSLDGWA